MLIIGGYAFKAKSAQAGGEMGHLNVTPRTMFCKDNLDVLQGINSDCIDLIYLDPPFNKNKVFTAPIGSAAEGAEFSDIFTEKDVKDEWVKTISKTYPLLYAFLSGVRSLGNAYNYCYLVYMSVRILECWRILKSTGSIYFHCDQTMSHYIKIMMDVIFGEKNFRNEVTFKRSLGHDVSNTMDVITDSILWYSKTERTVYNSPFTPLNEKEMDEKFPLCEEQTGRKYTHEKLEQSANVSSVKQTRMIHGREYHTSLGWRWKQKTFDERIKSNPHVIFFTGKGKPRYKRYRDEYKGRKIHTLWNDIEPLSSSSTERTGYPTQKPLKLLKRIIEASSNKGDVVLDPFCGCATTCVQAELSQRQWIGIDVSHKAYELVKSRLKKEMPKDLYRGDPNYDTKPPQRTDQGDLGKDKGFVYVISNKVWKDYYKVGISKNVDARLRTYQTGDPERAYKLEFKYESENYVEIEAYIHKKFENVAEWVKAKLEDITRAIKEYQPSSQPSKTPATLFET